MIMNNTDKTRDVVTAAITAIGNQRQIGKDNQLLWDIPADLKRFRELTTGHAVIMGRKTWESLPEQYRPLPGRENIVMTRNENFSTDGATVVHSPDEAMERAKSWSRDNDADELFIIGGEGIYKTFLPQTDRLYLTLVDSDKEGDTFFPEYEDEFPNETYREEREHDGLSYTWVNLERG